MPRSLILLLCLAAPIAGQAGTAALPEDEAGRCRYGVEAMIEHGRRALAEPRSRPERVEKRRGLVEQWSTRLAEGDDPCRLYSDIIKASPGF